MTIPISQIASVNPGVLPTAGSSLSLNGLLLTENFGVPIGAVQPFASAAAVGSFFGLASPEYEASLIYFEGPDNATTTPGQLLIATYPIAAVGAALYSGNLAGLSLTQLQALTGVLSITVDGVANTSSSINLSAATSFSNAATIIQAAFTSPNFAVAYQAQQQCFTITSTTTGVTTTTGYASGTISAGLLLTQATGAQLSLGAAAATPATFMPAVLNVAQNWATFTTVWKPSIADMTSFSLWTTQQKKRFAYCGWDNDPNAEIANSTTTWMYAVNLANMDGTIPSWGDITAAMLVMSWAASLNFSQQNGRTDLCFQSQAGLIPAVTSLTTANILVANGYNYYGAYAGNTATITDLYYNGQVSGSYDWADSYINQIKLTSDLQLALFTFLKNGGSVPYNAAGYAMIDQVITAPVNAHINFGTIRTGVEIAADQAQDLINAIGFDVSQILFAQGYYIQILPASPSTRVARSSPPMTLWYTDGGSVQQLTLASIEIQ